MNIEQIKKQVLNELIGRLLIQGYNLYAAEKLALELLENEDC